MLSQKRLSNHLVAIARLRDSFENPDSLQEVQHYIETEFRSYGFEIEKKRFSFHGRTFENVIARKGPSSRKVFIVGAHFDAVAGTPGADDNASGVAGMLEAARILADVPSPSPLPAGGERERVRGIEFVAFNLEEYNMAGSSEYVADLKKQKRTVLGMLSLEMIGYTSQEKGSQKIPPVLKPFYPDVGNFVALVGDGGSRKLLKKAHDAFKKVRGLPVETLTVPVKGRIFPETRLSDHSPFWDAGHPALLVTDTSFFRNPHYHLASDTIETLDLDFLEKVTEGVIQAAHFVMSS